MRILQIILTVSIVALLFDGTEIYFVLYLLVALQIGELLYLLRKFQSFSRIKQNVILLNCTSLILWGLLIFLAGTVAVPPLYFALLSWPPLFFSGLYVLSHTWSWIHDEIHT